MYYVLFCSDGGRYFESVGDSNYCVKDKVLEAYRHGNHNEALTLIKESIKRTDCDTVKTYNIYCI